MEITNIEKATEKEILRQCRQLKIIMTKDNILELCHKDPEICNYITKKNQTFDDICIYKSMFLQFIRLIDENKRVMNVDVVIDEMKKNYPIETETSFDWLLEMFLRDYNQFYLNDNYRNNGKWYNECWYKDNEDFDKQYKKFNTYTIQDKTTIKL